MSGGTGILYAFKSGLSLPDILRQALNLYVLARGRRPARVEVNADDWKSYRVDVLDSVPVSPGRSIARGMFGA